jgi:hypothetical protein
VSVLVFEYDEKWVTGNLFIHFYLPRALIVLLTELFLHALTRP